MRWEEFRAGWCRRGRGRQLGAGGSWGGEGGCKGSGGVASTAGAEEVDDTICLFYLKILI